MNPEQARARVADTFPRPFNKGKFLEFTRNLLNKFDESKAQAWNPTYVKDAFKPHVSRFERLGTYTSPDDDKLDVLIVHLTTESKLERARTAIRNFVADHLKTRDEKDAALVAFVSPTEEQWRFSYVKMEYAAVETEAGRVGVETRLTPARRYSYIVGEGESCHTAQTRFLALLQDTENYPTLAQLEEAFSVEAVTKEFFIQYARLFGDIDAALQKLAAKDKTIGSEFKEKHVSTVDFAKKLMGQIVFLYFLQKKGWLGVAKGQDWGTGPHDFLRRLAGSPLPSDGRGGRGEGRAYDNFFNDVLEPLFYDTLATDRGHEAWCNRFQCRIPFLNGGLFEPLADYDWRKTDIILPNKLFTNTERNDAGDIGTGVLDVFDRYNFTINEAEPLEKEVAIDPEMLGKVFENLIEDNRRKGLGSFYTPREIVHYMCQESLINYLDTAVNSRADSLSPRGTSGERAGERGSPNKSSSSPRPSPPSDGGEGETTILPRADLETFVRLGDQISHYEAVEADYRIKMPKSIISHAKRIDEKLADITVCDPAVGSGAFPVGMMSEIVRARSALTPYFNDVHDRTPYHFKRHAIQNCLYGVDIDPGAVEIAKLRLWLSLVVDEEDVKQIKPLPNLFYKIVSGNSLLGVEKNLFNQQLFQKLEKLKSLYFDQSDQSEKAALRRQIDQTIHELTNGKEAFDFEIYFSEVFHRKGGFDVVIANPPYVDVKGLPPPTVRVLFDLFETAKNRINLYAFFIEKSFSLLARRGTLAFINPNSLLVNESYTLVRKLILPAINKLVKLPDNVFENAVVETMLLFLAKDVDSSLVLGKQFANNDQLDLQSISFARFSKADWLQERECRFNISSGKASLDLCRKIEAEAKPLETFAEFSLGITPYDKYKGHSQELIEERRFHSDRKLSDSYVPLISGANVLRHVVLPEPEEWLKYGEWLGASREQRFFTQPRIIVRQIVSGVPPRIYAGYTTKHLYHTQIGFAVLKRLEVNTDFLFFLALLNSQLMNFYHAEAFLDKEKVTFQKILIANCKRFPVRLPNRGQEEAIVSLVNRILAAKQRDAEADVSALEREIDELVYALYGLTPEEIKIVEGANK